MTKAQSLGRSVGLWTRMQEAPLFWLLPAGLFLLVFYTWPLLDVIRLSFTNASLIGGDYEYGFDSYRRLFRDPATMRSLQITLIFAGGSVLLKLTLGMLLALAIDAGVKRGLKGMVVVRTSILAAWVIPGVIVGVLWKLLLSTSSHGLLNYWISEAFGTSVPFLTDTRLALLTAILANVWRGVAFTMIILYAGLQKIPAELYEAARIDGANAWARFRYVTLPQLVPVVFVSLVLMTISGVNTFDLIVALTEGGPARATEVIGLSVYQQVFKFMNLGRGAAVAVLLLAINLLMTLVYLWLLRVNRQAD
ncbi:carbohydrate ABC transporter permease [Devosia enhydra]|nr:sugar ABC transporter permease [Devosia enhydra]